MYSTILFGTYVSFSGSKYVSRFTAPLTHSLTDAPSTHSLDSIHSTYSLESLTHSLTHTLTHSICCRYFSSSCYPVNLLRTASHRYQFIVYSYVDTE